MMQTAKPNAERGLTLLEVLVTVVIVSLLAVAGVPSWRAFVQNNQRVATTNALLADLNYARSEAIRRGARISLCSFAAAAPANDSDTWACAGNANWEQGWMVFVDDVYTAVGTRTTGSGQEAPIRVGDNLPTGQTLRGGVNSISFLPTGRVISAGDFRLCDERGTTSGRTISVASTGKVAFSEGTASCP